jgi:hypothetical protein
VPGRKSGWIRIMTTEVRTMPKCTVCGKDVADIGPLDVPYHVECVMAAWDRALRSPGTRQAECSPHLAQVPAAMTPAAAWKNRSS